MMIMYQVVLDLDTARRIVQVESTAPRTMHRKDVYAAKRKAAHRARKLIAKHYALALCRVRIIDVRCVG